MKKNSETYVVFTKHFLPIVFDARRDSLEKRLSCTFQLMASDFSEGGEQLNFSLRSWHTWGAQSALPMRVKISAGGLNQKKSDVDLDARGAQPWTLRSIQVVPACVCVYFSESYLNFMAFFFTGSRPLLESALPPGPQSAHALPLIWRPRISLSALMHV